jgi:hypothetical protein
MPDWRWGRGVSAYLELWECVYFYGNGCVMLYRSHCTFIHSPP